MLTVIHQSQIDAITTSPRPGDIKHSCLDNSKAQNLLNWHPKMDIAQGLAETYHSLS
ncbi:hypothetical protein [Mesobacillus maritimus]|uniref:hypothetical protein n=1 Tax=Mesobacillus maritimus TaxID=1643336 RepID=UPI00384ECAAD